MSENSVFAGNMATEKLTRYKSPGIDRMPAELIQEGKRKLRSSIELWEHNSFCAEGGILPTCKTGDKKSDRTDCSDYRGA